MTTEGWSHSSRYSASSCSREVARTTQVTLRYLPCRLGRISTVAGSKSAACLSTISVTACAKPRSFLPITLIGKSQGKASGDSGRDRLALSSAHDLLLELLVELIHARKNRPGAAVADACAVERYHRQHLLRRGREPQLVGSADFVLLQRPEFERQAVRLRQLDHHVVGDPRKDEMVL